MEIRFFLGEVLTARSGGVYPCNGWRWVAGLWGSVCGSAGICCSALGASPSPLQRAVREEARVFPPNPASCCIPILYVPLLSTWISFSTPTTTVTARYRPDPGLSCSGGLRCKLTSPVRLSFPPPPRLSSMDTAPSLTPFPSDKVLLVQSEARQCQ